MPGPIPLHRSFDCPTLPAEGTMKRRNRIPVSRRFLNWLSNLSVGLVAGGLLAVWVTDNESGLNTIYRGIFIAYITFRALKEKGR